MKHVSKRLCALLLAAAFALCAGCAAHKSEVSPALVKGKEFCLRTSDGGYAPAFLNGVNIGAAKAGCFPGEFGVSEEEYVEWFKQIAAMNVNVIRVYVNQMPAFYDALKKFNRSSKTPLYLMQGVYVNEDLLNENQDVYGAVEELFYSDIRNAVDIIHGDAVIEKLPGNAGGEYKSDVSEWVIGWILGIEWSADIVLSTNAAHPDKTEFSGVYVKTRDASPFEVFLAGAAEEAIAREQEKYAVSRPVALSNWCTTDPLSHPNEPNAEMEDAVSVDVEHITATDAFESGFFASYHVYPYYPDFFSYDTKYADTGDPYLAYLEELNAYHTMPVLVSEYGIPSSRGIAHINTVTGMSQGHASEAQQGEWLIALNRDIRASGCVGGLIFSWQDEWFKRTWNSMDYEDADRRPFWHNLQSPEQNFGLFAFEPETAVTLDGSADEWNKDDLVISENGIDVYARSDAEYLYIMLDADGYDFENDTLYLPLDVLDGQGNTHYSDMTFDTGAEYLLRLHGKADSALLVDAYYDIFQYDYSTRLEYFDPLPGQYEKNSGCFNTIYLAMNRPQYLPETDVQNPFERFDTGALHYGCGDNESESCDSLSDLCCGEVTEIRLPWMLIGFMDPSTLLVTDDFNALGSIASVHTDGVRIGVCGEGGAANTALYTWDAWELPETQGRLKESYYMLQDYFAD